jgi:dihydroneopterin aldolase
VTFEDFVPMTLMLASVTSPAEAEIVLACDADIIDLNNLSDGALGALDLEVMAEILRAVAGRKLVSAAAGAAHAAPVAALAAATAVAATGVDYVRLGLATDGTGADTVQALGALASKTRLVGVLFADLEPDLALVKLMARNGFAGAMLDTAAKGDGRLLDHMGIAALHEFVGLCRAEGLMSGLAGALEAPDVPRLLPLHPDVLGFRGALCLGRARQAAIDRAAVRLIRDLVPRDADHHGQANDPLGDLGGHALRGGRADRVVETDKVFVHDLVLPCFIGAYDFERGTRQNVRFNVDVDVVRMHVRFDDMRGIFSYDLIMDAIRIILDRGHIDLIETIASELADRILRHASVLRVCVRVEKLDVVSGAVGVETRRERAADAAAVERLFAGLPGQAGTASRS